jgi:hypothetical protein
LGILKSIFERFDPPGEDRALAGMVDIEPVQSSHAAAEAAIEAAIRMQKAAPQSRQQDDAIDRRDPLQVDRRASGDAARPYDGPERRAAVNERRGKSLPFGRRTRG